MGVSLTAAASPISIPRGHFGVFTRTSRATSAIRTRLICPNEIVSRTGSSNSAPATASAVTIHAVRASNSGRSRSSTTRRVTTSAATETRVKTILPNVTGISARGAKSIADSGG